MIFDLIRTHYPRFIGQVLVLNYGWLHNGIWTIVSSLLTAESRSKIAFINEDELKLYISPSNIPTCINIITSDHGGDSKKYSLLPQSCPLIINFGKGVKGLECSDEFMRLFSNLVSDSEIPDEPIDVTLNDSPETNDMSLTIDDYEIVNIRPSTKNELGSGRIFNTPTVTFENNNANYQLDRSSIYSNSQLSSPIIPKSVKSAVDLQALLQSQNHVNRSPSNRSLAGLALSLFKIKNTENFDKKHDEKYLVKIKYSVRRLYQCLIMAIFGNKKSPRVLVPAIVVIIALFGLFRKFKQA
jgi:hypothetical protein